jgi:hypothetical protein
MPGGIDARVHFDQGTADDSVFADGFESGGQGAIVMDEAKMSGSADRGLFQKCDRPELARPRGKPLIDPSISIEPAFPLLMRAPPRYAKGVSIFRDREGVMTRWCGCPLQPPAMSKSRINWPIKLNGNRPAEAARKWRGHAGRCHVVRGLRPS